MSERYLLPSPNRVLRLNSAHERVGKPSVLYMSMVSKWRSHFYFVIHDVFENADQLTLPINFSPLEQYLGFDAQYHDIADLGADALANFRAPDEVEEGWYYIDRKSIHIFYDPTVSLVRQRFTITHEWGHVFQKLDWSFKSDMEAIQDATERNRIIHSVANHFAAYYLVPLPLLQRENEQQKLALPSFINDSIFLLAETFNVSVEVIRNSMTVHKLQ